MKKLFCATLIIFLICGTACAEKFPDLGECTGNGVRLREEPDTESEIVGQVNKNDSFVLLDANKINGGKWYLIDHPTKKGKAWIFGKYVRKYYELKDSDHTPAHVICMQVILDYGITPEKTRALHGKPLENLKDVYGNFIGLKYDGFEVNYQEEEGHISNVAVGFEDDGSKTGNFGGIKIGDDIEKLRGIFGKNLRVEDGFCASEAPSGEIMYFNIDENNKISSMQWLIEEH